MAHQKKRTPLTDSQQGLVTEALPWVESVIAVMRWRGLAPARWSDEDIASAAMIRLCLAAQRFDPAKARWRTYAAAQMQLGVLDAYRENNDRGWKRGSEVSCLPSSDLTTDDGGEEIPLFSAIPDQSPGLAERREQAEQILEDFAAVQRGLRKRDRRTLRRWAKYRTTKQDARADGVSVRAVAVRRNVALKAARRVAKGKAA